MNDLENWQRAKSPEQQEAFFRQAARFFSNRELAAIVENIQKGYSLFDAHLRAGVLDRYAVDLNELPRRKQRGIIFPNLNLLDLYRFPHILLVYLDSGYTFLSLLYSHIILLYLRSIRSSIMLRPTVCPF